MRCVPAAAVAILVVAGISACRGDEKKPDSLADRPPREIVLASAAAVRTADAIHIEGELRDKLREPSRVVVDVVGVRLHMRVVSPDEGSMEFVLIGGDAYFKGDLRALKRTLGSAASELFAGRWLKAPADQFGEDTKDLIDEFSPERLAYCLPRGLGTLEKLGVDRLDGRRVVVVSDRGDKPGTAPGKLYVAAEGEPLPVRIEQTGPARPGGERDPRCDDPDFDSDFTSGDIRLGYGKSVVVTPPADAVDLSELAGESATQT